MNAREMIRRYAEMQITAERLQMAGRPVPHDLTQALQFMESLSRDFGPVERQALAQEVQLHKDSLLAMEMRGTAQLTGRRRAAAAELTQALRDRSTREATRTLSRDGQGLTQGQFHELRQTGKYTVPGRTRQREAVARQFAAMGLGDDTAAILKRLDELHDNPRMLEEHAEKLFPGDVLSQSRFKNALKTAVLENAMAERAEQRMGDDAFRDRAVEATEAERRRADVLFAIGQEDAGQLVSDEIPRRDLEDEGLRGSIARAMRQHDDDPLSGVDDAEYERLERVAAGAP